MKKRLSSFSLDKPLQVAEIIKEYLCPNPLTYFNSEADEEEFDGDEEAKEDDDDEEEEDDGDDED